jgi:hypothetical protein
MDIDNARYLLSALIQATAIAFGFAVALDIHLTCAREKLRKMTDIGSIFKSLDTTFTRWALGFVALLALGTILSGIYAFTVLNEPDIISEEWTSTPSGSAITITAILSALTFIVLTVLVLERVITAESD